MFLRKKRLVAKLVGGLGNQLFIYFAALDLAQKNHRKLILDFSFIERSHSSGQSRLDVFSIEGEKIESSGVIKVFKTVKERILDSLSKHMSLFTLSYIDEQTIGQLQTRSHARSFYLRGFHSTAKHYASLGSPGLKLKHESPEYASLKSQIIGSVALHVRGGDYGIFSSTFGPLSPGYYLGILNSYENVALTARLKGIYVFSDDRERSSNLRILLEARGYRVIEVSFLKDLFPAEELLLMSVSGVLITANSTFSFWAAELSTQETVIISPSNYTRTGDTVDFQSSRNRIVHKSDWE